MKKGLLVVILFVCCIFSGCSQKEKGVPSDTSVNEAESTVPYVEWNDTDIGDTAKFLQMRGNSIYTAEWKFDYSNMKKTECKVICENEGIRDTIAEFEDELIYFQVAGDGAIYYLYSEGEGCYLRKDNGDLKTEYVMQVVWENKNFDEIYSELCRIDGGCVNNQGELCLNAEGDLYLFNSEGKLISIIRNAWEDGFSFGADGLVNRAGEIYLYRLEAERVALWQLNMDSCALERKEYLLLDSEAMAIYGGDELYIMDAEGLLIEQEEGAVLNRVLKWEDSQVNLQAEYVEALGFGDMGEIFVLYNENSDENSNIIKVEYKSSSEAVIKQKVILGCIDGGMVSQIKSQISKFNRQNEEYYIELLVYEWSEYEDYYKDLLFGEGADIYMLNDMPREIMAEKGILEDLSPYFEGSDVIKEDDLLPRIREACYVDDKMLYIIPSFAMGGFIVEEGWTNEGGWSFKQLYELAMANPSSRVCEQDEAPNMFYNILSGYISSNINWQEKTSSFDSEEFIAFLEMVKEISDREYTGELSQSCAAQLYNKEYLTRANTVGGVLGYAEMAEAFGGFAELAGLPYADGTPHYRIITNNIYGINSASKCKEGAWEFIEYILSEEWQEAISESDFPVRTDMFDAVLEAAQLPKESDRIVYFTNSYTNERKEGYPEFTAEYASHLRFMADNMYLDDTMQIRTVQEIVIEEIQSYFYGDKTADEVAEIIQNRIMLFLNE